MSAVHEQQRRHFGMMLLLLPCAALLQPFAQPSCCSVCMLPCAAAPVVGRVREMHAPRAPCSRPARICCAMRARAALHACVRCRMDAAGSTAMMIASDGPLDLVEMLHELNAPLCAISVLVRACMYACAESCCRGGLYARACLCCCTRARVARPAHGVHAVHALRAVQTHSEAVIAQLLIAHMHAGAWSCNCSAAHCAHACRSVELQLLSCSSQRCRQRSTGCWSGT
jgi:hypothetical protein